MKAEYGILNEREQMIMLRLYRVNKEVVKTSLLNLVPNSYSLDKYLDHLKEYNLINIREEKVIRRTFYISITKKGYAISRQLAHIEELLKMNFDDFNMDPSFSGDNGTVYEINNHNNEKKLCQICMFTNPSMANFCMFCGSKLE
ncbi:hypothetical protein [Picrophilus oshimae]|uniref:Uncharacterized protein n=1 Tax=Picrophilus torridus (strain ATCC 700027 / DSM 9790 / JCM 10055 / NBRC 100828 / KAW 2/3) TaxID=1122961 RepID=Q6L2B8_PICTO|nr:hypothetical protein [Picrophilus oshimae]AAT42884.1 hypothetical protein PTO0299 [Picrophilus oshimae DSM 9789]